MRKAVLPVLAALVLAGCGSEEVEALPQQAEPDLEDCGSYESLNEPSTAEEEAKNRCLLDAFEAGRPAMLVFTLATVEGDPITHHLTVTESGQLEVMVDATKDKFGDGRWHSSVCTGLTEERGRLAWTGCAETDVPKDPALTNPQQPG